RRRHTRFSRDWSSDVCSSDLCASCHWASVGLRSIPESCLFFACGYNLDNSQMRLVFVTLIHFTVGEKMISRGDLTLELREKAHGWRAATTCRNGGFLL